MPEWFIREVLSGLVRKKKSKTQATINTGLKLSKKQQNPIKKH